MEPDREQYLAEQQRALRDACVHLMHRARSDARLDEDDIQEAYVRLSPKLRDNPRYCQDQVTGRPSARAAIGLMRYAMSRRELDRWRERVRHPTTPLVADGDAAPLPLGELGLPRMEDGVVDLALAAAILAAIRAEVPRACRALDFLTLKVEGYAEREIAQRYDMTRAAVAQAIKRGRDDFAAWWEENAHRFSADPGDA